MAGPSATQPSGASSPTISTSRIEGMSLIHGAILRR
jgi:hypothetical protein